MVLRDSRLQVVRDLERETTAQCAPLPKCATVEDHALVYRASEEIRSILGRTVARGLEEVGKTILQEFYHNDPALYRSAHHHKHVSLRLLVKRCEAMDPPIRRTVIANAVQMACLIRELPSGSPFLELPPTHRVELLRAGSPERVDELAGKALVARMTVKKIKETVRKDGRKQKSKRGRKPVPSVVKALRVIVKLLRDPSTGRLSFRREDIDALNDAYLSDARANADTAAKRIEEFMTLLG